MEISKIVIEFMLCIAFACFAVFEKERLIKMFFYCFSAIFIIILLSDLYIWIHN